MWIKLCYNYIICFCSGLDNGGEAHFAGSNWPFRGEKSTYYEGGLKVPTFVSSPLLSSPRAISNELIHVSDWFPTLVHLAGGDTEDLEIDGYNQWDTIWWIYLFFSLRAPRTDRLVVLTNFYSIHYQPRFLVKAAKILVDFTIRLVNWTNKNG